MVLVYAESPKGQFKKAALEAVTYGAKVAAALKTECVALTLGTVTDAGSLGEYGASKVYNIASSNVQSFDSQSFTTAIANAAQALNASDVILSHSANGKSLTGRLAVRLNAGTVSGANAMPQG